MRSSAWISRSSASTVWAASVSRAPSTAWVESDECRSTPEAADSDERIHAAVAGWQALAGKHLTGVFNIGHAEKAFTDHRHKRLTS